MSKNVTVTLTKTQVLLLLSLVEPILTEQQYDHEEGGGQNAVKINVGFRACERLRAAMRGQTCP
jgi:hypothetical protein